MKDSEVREFISDMKAKYSSRDAEYRTVEDVYYHNNYTGILDKILEDGTDRRGTKLLYNMIRTRTFHKTSLLRGLPDINCDPPPGSGPDGDFWAEFMMRILTSYWDYWKLEQKTGRMGGYLSLYGAFGLELVPDFKDKRVKTIIYKPAHCYAEEGLDGEIERFLTVVTPNGRQLLSMYPELGREGITNTSAQYELATFTDKQFRFQYVNTKSFNEKGSNFVRVPGQGIKHEFGFVPGTIVSNDHMSLFGVNDAYHSLGLQENMNDILILSVEDMRERIGSTMVISSDDDLPDDFEPGRGQFLKLKQGSGVQYVSPVSGQTSEAAGAIQHQEHMLRNSLNFPEVSSGISPASSIVTGNAVNALAGAVVDDTQTLKAAMGTALVYINRSAVAMERKIFPKVKQKAMGTFRNEENSFVYIPGEDLPEEFTHRLTYHPYGRDLPQVIVNVIQMVQSGLLDVRSGIERIPGVNPDEILRRIKEDKIREAEIQREIMQIMQPPQPMGAQGPGGMPGMPAGDMPMPEEEMPMGPIDVSPDEVARAALSLEKGGIPGSAEALMAMGGQ